MQLEDVWSPKYQERTHDGHVTTDNIREVHLERQSYNKFHDSNKTSNTKETLFEAPIIAKQRDRVIQSTEGKKSAIQTLASIYKTPYENTELTSDTLALTNPELKDCSTYLSVDNSKIVSDNLSTKLGFQSKCSPNVESITSPYFRKYKYIIPNSNYDIKQPTYPRQVCPESHLANQTIHRESLDPTYSNKMNRKKRVKSKNLVVRSDLLPPFEF